MEKDDNISFTTMQKYAADMFGVLLAVERWQTGEDDEDDNNEFHEDAAKILENMREETP